MENTTDAPGRSVASTGDAWTTGSDTPHRRASAPPLSHRDQMLAALFGLWMIVGLFLDGWAHDNQKPESFSTPWRGVLYSGFTAAGLFALHRAARGHVSGRPWHDTMPRGHGLTLAAFGVFAVAASGDLVWHQVFGIEVGLEALPQPHPPPLDGKWAGCAQRAHPSVVGRARRSALAAGVSACRAGDDAASPRWSPSSGRSSRRSRTTPAAPRSTGSPASCTPTPARTWASSSNFSASARSC